MEKKEKFWSLEKNNSIEKFIDMLFKLVSMVAILATVVIMVITVADVILRAVASKSVTGVMELTQFLMVFVCYFSMPWVTWQFGHIKVDLLTTKLPEKAQGVILVADKLLCIAFTVLMIYEVWKQGAQAKIMHSVGAVTRIPVYPFYYITSIMMVFVLVAMIINIISLVALGKEKDR